MSVDRELETYCAEAAAWDLDRIARLHRSERRAWFAAAGGALCAILCAAALVLLVPLKQIAPFLIRVDNTTGIVDVAPTAAGRVDPGEAVTRYLLTHYIMVCERFNFATAESDYSECGAFHSAQRNQAWYAAWNPANPASPLNVYKDGTTIRATVVSVSFFRRSSGITDLAQVRYLKRLRRAGAAEEEVTHWIATIQYAYTSPSQDVRVRSLNPLGFKVVDFRPEPEVVAEPVLTGGAVSTGAAGGATK